jgi:hypothetical protein
MSRLFTRWFSVVLFVFGGQAWADIPMVTTPMIRPNVLAMPQLPQHGVQEFMGAREVSVRSGDDLSVTLDVQSQTDVSAFGVACDIDLQINPRPNAMIELDVFAPCQPHATVHVSHGGFGFETQVSLTGRTSLIFPGMQREAKVFVAVGEDVFERQIQVEDVEHLARIALVGVSGSDAELVASWLSSEMDVYQNRGVQVFSVDIRERNTAMTYRMTLRHQVTAQNCDQPVHTLLRRVLPGLAEQSQVLRLDAQDCNRIGDILELKNIVQDLKLAAN